MPSEISVLYNAAKRAIPVKQSAKNGVLDYFKLSIDISHVCLQATSIPMQHVTPPYGSSLSITRRLVVGYSMELEGEEPKDTRASLTRYLFDYIPKNKQRKFCLQGEIKIKSDSELEVLQALCIPTLPASVVKWVIANLPQN
ncbi:hypothetical protein AMATHDRAFT_50331 [Amanita thiersii Skay4041]|uniref:Uncharacterized protein n=1 Tax=Amanita thiersii Skay4041 TaxID=703135 RepID=A0A2A9NI16_9AGAR|nr:hypothetical protein AMATHDRAFT_50331 [Amanita thiersii Skay4041]